MISNLVPGFRSIRTPLATGYLYLVLLWLWVGGLIPPSQTADGKIVRGEEILGRLNLGTGKPEHIFAQTGRLPVFAGGNADVDIEMLEAAKFGLLINHDDPDREFGYTSGAEASMVKAEKLGWTVVSMKNDWDTVYGKLADL